MASKSSYTEAYYDIMIIGMTGQGMSTTADKILIANPKGLDYRGEQQKDPILEVGKLKMSDFCLWNLSTKADELEKSKARIKNLIYFRSLENPHQEINIGHDGEMSMFDITRSCKLISNDTTMIRVLDVPGFFGKNDYVVGSRSSNASDIVQMNGLSIVRNIIQIQTAMGMKFRRILYFLSVRDALVRDTDIVRMELEWLSHFFGDTILKCMVLVATVSPEFSKHDISDDEKFPERNVQKTLRKFKEILQEVFPNSNIPVPPLIFLSLSETCESVLEKVKSAVVQVDNGLVLQFLTNACANCGIKVGSKNKETLACCFEEDWSTAFTYDETTCHPVFIPENSAIKKIVNGVVYAVSLQRTGGIKFKESIDEVCANCGGKPGSRGCMKVGTEYDLKEQGKLMIDHTSTITRAIHIDWASSAYSRSESIQVADFVNQKEDDSVRVEHIHVHMEPQLQPIITRRAAPGKEFDSESVSEKLNFVDNSKQVSTDTKAKSKHNFKPIPGKRKIWGTVRACSSIAVKKTIIKFTGIQAADMEIKRKFKMSKDKKVVTKWWHVLIANEDILQTIEHKWEKVEVQTSWSIHPVLCCEPGVV